MAFSPPTWKVCAPPTRQTRVPEVAGVANRFPAVRRNARTSNRRERLVSSSLFPPRGKRPPRVAAIPHVPDVFATERRKFPAPVDRWYLRQMSRIAGVREGRRRSAGLGVSRGWRGYLAVRMADINSPSVRSKSSPLRNGRVPGSWAIAVDTESISGTTERLSARASIAGFIPLLSLSLSLSRLPVAPPLLSGPLLSLASTYYRRISLVSLQPPRASNQQRKQFSRQTDVQPLLLVNSFVVLKMSPFFLQFSSPDSACEDTCRSRDLHTIVCLLPQ